MREDLLDSAELLGLVVDHEIPFVTQLLDVLAQNAHTKRMKRADCWPQWLLTIPRLLSFGNQFANPFLHLARRFIRERDPKNVLRRNAALDHVCDAISDDAGFPGPGAGQNQHGTMQRLDS